MTKITQEQNDKFSDRFRFIWEQYIKVINLIITLTTGTLLLFINIALNKDAVDIMKNTSPLFLWCGFLSVILFLIALIFSVIWRLTSQSRMEKDVLGDYELATEYLKQNRIYDYPYDFEAGINPFQTKWWIISRSVTYFSLGLGWFLFAIFFTAYFFLKYTF